MSDDLDPDLDLDLPEREDRPRTPFLKAMRRRDSPISWRDIASRLRRNRFFLIIAALMVAWFVGAIFIHLAEGRGNPAYATFGESLWNVWLALFNGMNDSPKTVPGRIAAIVVLIVGVCLIGVFTGNVASIFVERRLRRREVSQFEMEDHLVLCNWAPRALDWIQEVHSKIIQEKRPVVIIHDDPEQIDLPDKQEDAAFNDVYIVKGDPTNEVILRRARVPRAFSVIILSDDRQGDHADGKTILTCIALQNLCKTEPRPNISVECRNPLNRNHLRKAGADEIISSDELGLRLLARSSLYHGMTSVYQELLTVGRDANEMYLLELPQELVGRDFVEVSSMFLRHRTDKRSCLLIGYEREEEMHINPIASEAGAMKAGDKLIMLGRVFLNPSQALPTVPPLKGENAP